LRAGALGARQASKGCGEPGPEVPIGQQIEAEEGREIRETPRPGGRQLQKLQQKHRQQGDPDLDMSRGLTRADEGFSPEMLLQGLNEQLDQPPPRIDRGHASDRQMPDIGQKGEGPLLCRVLDRHLPERDGPSIRSMQAGQVNHLIREHGGPGEHKALVQDLIQHIGPRACDTPDTPHPGCGPALLQSVVEVAEIHRNDGAGL
jgi:hypothetical protein